MDQKMSGFYQQQTHVDTKGVKQIFQKLEDTSKIWRLLVQLRDHENPHVARSGSGGVR